MNKILKVFGVVSLVIAFMFLIHYSKNTWDSYFEYEYFEPIKNWKSYHFEILINTIADLLGILIVFIYILITIFKVKVNSKEPIKRTISNTKKEIELLKLKKELEELKK